MDYTLDKKLMCFKQIAQEKLQAILCSIPNSKELILEPSLIKPLENVCSASWVKSKGVTKIFKFDQKHAIPRQGSTQVYLISANLTVFKHVLDQINAYENQNMSATVAEIKMYHIIVLPNVYTSFRILLEEEGLYGHVALHKFNWDFIHLDDCVLSLEIPQVFGDIFVRKNTMVLSSLAHSLRLLEVVVGKPDVLLTYGLQSLKLVNMIDRLNSGSKSNKLSDFSAMIVMDRDKDFPSCLLTPASYAALIMEVFKCRAGEAETQRPTNNLSAEKLEIFQVPKSKEQTTNFNKARMNGKYDEIFAENRYKHFSEASNFIRTQAKTLGLEVQNINKMKISEMHDYVATKLQKITDKKNKILKHLKICEEIIHELAGGFQKQQSLEEDILSNSNRKQVLVTIDEILTMNGHKYNILRLLCLVHLSMGLSADAMGNFIKNYCNVFGYKYLYVFQHLIRAGLLPEIETFAKSKLLSNISIPKFQQTEFQSTASRLKLLPVVTDKSWTPESFKLCPSYVFNGSYIPVIAQLAMNLLNAKNAEELNSKLGLIEKIQIRTSESSDFTSTTTFHQSVKKGDFKDVFPLKKSALFIFILGGVTYAEISACDMISKVIGCKIVIASNCIVSGQTIISEAF